MQTNKISKKNQVNLYCKNINNKYKVCKLNYKIKTNFSVNYKSNFKECKKTQRMMNKY